MWGEMFERKYAQKDASKVNMYEIAQLSRASAATSQVMHCDGERGEKSCEEKKQKQRENWLAPDSHNLE